MPYPKHFRLTFGGDLFNTETWSCSINLALFTSVPWSDATMIAHTDEQLADVAADVKAYFLDPKSHVNAGCHLNFVKYNAINTDGRYLDKSNTREETWNHQRVAAPGSAGTAPAQQAVAISLRTNVKRGPGSHGRFFMPLGAVPIDGTFGTMSAPTVPDLRDSAVIFLTALNNWPGLDLDRPEVAVVSGLGSGHQTKVTSLAIGNVVDTQRRRRKSIPETYTAVAVG